MRMFTGKHAARHQSGAALATALLFLIVLTLLSLVAMRSGRVDLRLALNDEVRMSAQQNAQSVLDAVLLTPAYLSVRPGSGYVQACYLGSGGSLDAAQLLAETGFACPDAGADAIVLPDLGGAANAYAAVRRDEVAGLDYAPMAALREGDSGLHYRLASFTVTGGYDRSAEGLGAAQVEQGVFVKVDTRRGLSLR